MITDVIGQGDKAEAIVRFRDVGEKRLLLAWAPLKKLDELAEVGCTTRRVST